MPQLVQLHRSVLLRVLMICSITDCYAEDFLSPTRKAKAAFHAFANMHGSFVRIAISVCLWMETWPLLEHLQLSITRYVTRHNSFSHPTLVIYVWQSHPVKMKLGQQIGGGTTNSKPHGPIFMIDQSETLSSSQIIFSTLFSAMCTTVFASPFTSHCRLCNCAAPKPFWHLSRYMYILTFLHPFLLCRIT
jgi:hypothetical protein